MGNLFRAIQLFLQIVWRDSPAGGRMGIALSWDISAGLHGLKGKNWGKSERGAGEITQ